VIGFKNETEAAYADSPDKQPTGGIQPRIFGQPIALTFGIGQAF
jgi:hypothetical protein